MCSGGNDIVTEKMRGNQKTESSKRSDDVRDSSVADVGGRKLYVENKDVGNTDMRSGAQKGIRNDEKENVGGDSKGSNCGKGSNREGGDVRGQAVGDGVLENNDIGSSITENKYVEVEVLEGNDEEVGDAASEISPSGLSRLTFDDKLHKKFTEALIDAIGSDENIASVKWDPRPGDVGEHHMSSVSRCIVTLKSLPKGSKWGKKKRHLIVKTMPDGYVVRSRLTAWGVFENEAKILSEVLPSIQEYADSRSPGSFQSLGPNYVLHGTHPDFFIATDDLSVEGYKVQEAVRDGLDMNHSVEAIRALARFHAASRALIQKGGSEVEQHLLDSALKADCGDPKDNQQFVEMFRVAGQEMAKWDDFPLLFSNLVTKMGPHVHEILDIVQRPLPYPFDFSVVVHGDFWINNLLFRHADDGSITGVRAVDWQMTRYGSPVVDLLYFINTSVSEEVWEKQHDLIKEYYNTFSYTMMRELGCDNELSYELIEEQMNMCKGLALFAAVHILPLVKKEDGASYDMEQTVSNPAINAHLYQSPAYIRWMRRVLPHFLRQGWL